MSKSTKRGVHAIRVTSIVVVIIGIFLVSGKVQEIRSANNFKEKVPEVQQIFNNSKRDIDLLRTGEFGSEPMMYLSNRNYGGEMMLTVLVLDEASLILNSNDYTLEEALDLGILPKKEIEAIERITMGEVASFHFISSYAAEYKPNYFEGCFAVEGGNAKISTEIQQEGRQEGSYICRLDNVYFVRLGKQDKYRLC